MSAQIYEQLVNMCRAAEKKLRLNIDHYRVLYSKLIVDNQDNPPACDICLGQTESDDSGDFFMTCKLCNCLTHVSCYGARFNSDDKDFLCIRCAYLVYRGIDYNRVRCVFCPELRGMMKPINVTQLDREWAHRTCGNYIVGCWWDDSSPLGPLSFNKEYKKQEITLPCQVCESKYGRTMKCDSLTAKGCGFMAHVTCYMKVGIIRNWVDMRQQSEENGYPEDTFVTIILCFEHLQKNKIRFRNANQQFDALHEGMFYFEEMNNPTRNNYMNSLAFKETFRNRYIYGKGKRHTPHESNDESSGMYHPKSQSQHDLDKEPSIKLAPYFLEVDKEDLIADSKKIRTFIETHFKDKPQASNFLMYALGLAERDIEVNQINSKLTQIKKIRKKQQTRLPKKSKPVNRNDDISVTDLQRPVEKSFMDLEKSINEKPIKQDLSVLEQSIIEQKSKDVSHLQTTPHFPQVERQAMIEESLTQSQATNNIKQLQSQYPSSQQTQPPLLEESQQQPQPVQLMPPKLSQQSQQTPSRQITQQPISQEIKQSPPVPATVLVPLPSPPPPAPPKVQPIQNRPQPLPQPVTLTPAQPVTLTPAQTLAAPPPSEPELKKRTKTTSGDKKLQAPNAQLKQLNSMLNQSYNQVKFIRAHRDAQKDESESEEEKKPDKATYIFNLKVQVQYLKTLKAILTEKAIKDGLM